MAILNFCVKGQLMTSNVPKLVVSDSINLLDIGMHFDEKWNGMNKWIHFIDEAHEKRIDIEVDGERKTADLEAGIYTVYAHGVSETSRIVTNKVILKVERSGAADGQPLPPIDVTAAEQIALNAQRAKEIAEELRRDADSGRFDGKNYEITEADYNEIAGRVDDRIAGNRDEAIEAVEAAGTAEINKVNAAGSDANAALNLAKEAAVNAVNAAKTEGITEVDEAKAEAINAVQTAGNAAISQAGTYAYEANEAKKHAQAAEAAADSYKDAAQNAKLAAENAESNADAAAGNARSAALAASNAADQAENAREAAAAHAGTAQTAKENAEAAAQSVADEVDQIEKNKNGISQLCESIIDIEKYTSDPYTYSVRALGLFGAGGLSNIAFDPNQFYRCSSISLIYAQEDINVHVKQGYRFGWSEGDSTGTTFIKWNGWFTNDATIKKGTYFRIQIAKVQESQGVTANVHEFTNAVTYDTAFNSVENDILFIQDCSLKNNKGIDYLYNYGLFIRGSLDYGNYQARDYRVCSDEIINFGRNVSLTVKNGFRIVTEIWENGIWKSSVTWRTGTIELDNRDYKFVIARTTEKTSEVADIKEFACAITLETEIANRVSTLEKFVNTSNYVETPWIQEIHRGITSETIFENTVASMLEASKQGFKQVECDVRKTLDGVIVMSHEPNIGDYVIANTNYDTLKYVTLATDSVYGVQHIATFEEVLKVAYFKGLTLNVDIKDSTIIDNVVNAVLASGMSGRVIYAPNTGATSIGQHILSMDKKARILYAYNKDNIENYWGSAFSDKSRIIIWQFFYNVTDESLSVVRNSGFSFLIADVLNSDYFAFRPDIIEYRTAKADTIHSLNKGYMDSLTF